MMEASPRTPMVALVSGLLADLRSLMTVVLLCLMLVYLLHSVTGLSLWASYGVVAMLAAAGAAGLGYRVMTIGSSLRLWPFRTLHSLKKDIQWIKEPVFSAKT